MERIKKWKKAVKRQRLVGVAAGAVLGLCVVQLLLPRKTGPVSPSSETAQAVATAPATKAAVLTTTTGVPTTATILPSATGKVLIPVEVIHQFPEYPTGCESMAAVMALRHAGRDMTVATFVDNYLPCSMDFYWYGGKFYGPSPYEYFLGNPRTNSSYGCMAPVIKQALTKALSGEKAVIDATGQSLPALCTAYVDCGYPVIVWVSINMVAIKDGRQWILPNGDTYAWPSNEHCMLLVGYDAQNYYFNDPYTGQVVGHSRALAESRYAQMGNQALVIQ